MHKKHKYTIKIQVDFSKQRYNKKQIRKKKNILQIIWETIGNRHNTTKDNGWKLFRNERPGRSLKE